MACMLVLNKINLTTPLDSANISTKQNIMSKKYELTKSYRIVKGTRCFQIRALRDFRNIKAGDLGGWIEGEYNLSQEGTCWVHQGATLYGSNSARCNDQVHANTDEDYGYFPLGYDIQDMKRKTDFDFSTLASNVSEITVDNIKYVKITRWEEQN